MSVREISVQMPNEPGTLSQLSTLLGEAGINIIAFFVSTATPHGRGLLRFVCNNPDKAMNVLGSKGMEPQEGDVVAAETPHHPGGLNAILTPLFEAGINLDYIYPCLNTGAETVLILGMADTATAETALTKNWIKLYGEELYRIAG